MVDRLPHIESLTALLSPEALGLLNTTGADLVAKLGFDALQGVVLDVLSGHNLRDSTEMLTRRRLAVLNAALVAMFLEGTVIQPDFVDELPHIATRILEQKRLTKAEKWVAQWALGLTSKATQNVLRDDVTLLDEYRKRYTQTCESVIQESLASYGDLVGEIGLGDNLKSPLTWKFMVYLLGAAGAQTLTIRGSEKSTYGKLFESLVLGTLLSILGFEYQPDGAQNFKNEFWLSSSPTNTRESDATALVKAGQGVRFDIVFIGRGNPEISLDKVTRFAREVEMNDVKWYMATIIIVDRIGPGSRIKEMAQGVDGDIVQMSMGYWPQEVAQILHQRTGFEHPLVTLSHKKVRAYLREAIQQIDLTAFL